MLNLVAAILIALACAITLVTVAAVWKANDALTRANLLTTTTSLALPLLIIAKLIRSIALGEFGISDLVVAFLAITALLVVLAVGSFMLGRSLYEVEMEREANA